MNEQTFLIDAADAGKRIDSYLSEQLDGVTRSMAQNWIERKLVTQQGRALKKIISYVPAISLMSRFPKRRRFLWYRKISPFTSSMKMQISLSWIKCAEWLCTQQQETGTEPWSMRLCFIAENDYPVSTVKSAPVSCTELIKIPVGCWSLRKMTWRINPLQSRLHLTPQHGNTKQLLSEIHAKTLEPFISRLDGIRQTAKKWQLRQMDEMLSHIIRYWSDTVDMHSCSFSWKPAELIRFVCTWHQLDTPLSETLYTV